MRMTIMPVMGIKDCVQVRLQGGDVDIVTEGTRRAAIEYATREACALVGAICIRSVVDMTAERIPQGVV